jgi:hypothetical protein
MGSFFCFFLNSPEFPLDFPRNSEMLSAVFYSNLLDQGSSMHSGQVRWHLRLELEYVVPEERGPEPRDGP